MRRAAWFLLLWSSAGYSQTPPATFPLSVEVAPTPGCPSRDAIEQALRERDLPFRAPGPGEPATTLRFQFHPSRDLPAGILELRLLNGETTRRELRGLNCEEVAHSLVLVAVLALAPLYAPPPPPPLPPSSSSPLPLPPAPAPAAAPPARERLPRRWSAGIEVGMMSGLGPRVAPGIGSWGQRRAGPVALRLGVGVWPHGGVNVDAFRARFTAYLLDASACLPTRLSREVEGLACGGVHGGILEAQGQQIEEPRAERRPWLAPRLGGRLSWAPETARRTWGSSRRSSGIPFCSSSPG